MTDFFETQLRHTTTSSRSHLGSSLFARKNMGYMYVLQQRLQQQKQRQEEDENTMSLVLALDDEDNDGEDSVLQVDPTNGKVLSPLVGTITNNKNNKKNVLSRARVIVLGNNNPNNNNQSTPIFNPSPFFPWNNPNNDASLSPNVRGIPTTTTTTTQAFYHHHHHHHHHHQAKAFVAYEISSADDNDNSELLMDRFAVLQILSSSSSSSTTNQHFQMDDLQHVPAHLSPETTTSDTATTKNTASTRTPVLPAKQQQVPLIVPTQSGSSSSGSNGILAPYYDHGTIHMFQTWWSMILPITVPTQVADVWRGYMVQTLYRQLLNDHDTKKNVVYLPPPPRLSSSSSTSSTKRGNNKNPDVVVLEDAKMAMEWQTKTDLLILFLSTWQCNNKSAILPSNLRLVRCMEDLWIDLYEFGFLELDDIQSVQLWLETLLEMKYPFPYSRAATTTTKTATSIASTTKRHDDVVVMGQFNYADVSIEDVLVWNSQWHKYVNRTVIRGPFSESQLQEFRNHGITAFHGRNDHGFVSPLENLAQTLKQYRDEQRNVNDTDGSSSITGFMYVHDDAIVNLPHLFRSNKNKQSILVNFDTRDPRYPVNQQHIKSLNQFSYKILPNGTFVKQDGYQTRNPQELLKNLRGWYHHSKCIASLSNVVKDPRVIKYQNKDDDNSFMVPIRGQSDFLYVPVHLADDFIDAAQLLVDHDVFLECAFPIVADILRTFSGASVQMAGLCTDWNKKYRGTLNMMNTCGNSQQRDMDVVHPLKLKQLGYKTWCKTFDKLMSASASMS